MGGATPSTMVIGAGFEKTTCGAAGMSILRADAPLFDAPLTVPAVSSAATNAPGASTGTTNAAPTNTAAKPFTAEELLKAVPEKK